MVPMTCLRAVDFVVGSASKREISTKSQGSYDGCRGGIRCGVDKSLLEIGVIMEHSHYVWNGFMYVPIIRVTIMPSAPLHKAVVTNGLIVRVHNSYRSLGLGGSESLLSQQRSKWFVFRQEGLFLGIVRAIR